MLWFDFILGLNLFSFVSNSLSYINLTQKQTGQQNLTKDKNEPQSLIIASSRQRSFSKRISRYFAG